MAATQDQLDHHLKAIASLLETDVQLSQRAHRRIESIDITKHDKAREGRSLRDQRSLAV